MTWKPGSIGSLPGHVQIKNCYGIKRESVEGYKYKMTHLALAELSIPSDYTLCQLMSHNYTGFMNVSGTVYYINGRRVFETDIKVSPLSIRFCPVAKAWDRDTQVMRDILFREMDKLEWLFT
jgi:hypothetical protein